MKVCVKAAQLFKYIKYVLQLAKKDFGIEVITSFETEILKWAHILLRELEV